MKIAAIITIVLIAYSVCFGSMVGVINNSKLYQEAIRTLSKDKQRELTGLLLIIAPISIILTILCYIGYVAYCITYILLFDTDN